jgi:FAD/FMN-containing dehydrogenase
MRSFDELGKIFEQGNVIADSATLEALSKDESFAPPLKPRCLVRAQTAGEVQELVRLANETLTPLIPLSSGPPHFRGDTVPSAPEAIIVDLSSMRKIIHVDQRNRMAIIEPGVTYAQLQPELAKYGLRLSSPLAPRANKSVIGALLEREPVTIPRYQWAMLDPLRCTEVIWGDGQRMTTGEALSTEALPQEWARHFAQVNPSGPGQTNFYKFTSAAQGSMGIVTWASVKCEVLPRVHKLFFVPASSLEELIDLAYSILRIRFGDELLIVNNSTLATLLGKDPTGISTIAARLPRWMILIGIAGRDTLPEERVEYQQQDISEMAQKSGLRLLPAIPGANATETLNAVLNPCAGRAWRTAYRGAGQDLFFLNTLDNAPLFVNAMYILSEAHGYPVSQVGVYIQPVQQGASCHIEFNLPFDRVNPEETGRVQEIYEEASREMLKRGAYYSRPYGIWSRLAFNGDAQSTISLKKIKGIFDPNNIMNPGKLCF